MFMVLKVYLKNRVSYFITNFNRHSCYNYYVIIIMYILHGYTNVVFSLWLLIFKAMPNLPITLTLLVTFLILQYYIDLSI